MLNSYVEWEISLLRLVQENASDFWNYFWTAVTMLGESGIFWIVLALVLMIPNKTRRLGFSMGLALLIGLILCNGVLKNVVARTRPYDLELIPPLEHRLAWGEMTNDYSFPSGHTTASFEGAVAIFLRNKKWGIAALALAVLIGVSRFFLGVHFPSDIVAGALCGTLFAYMAARAVDALWSLYDRKKAQKDAK